MRIRILGLGRKASRASWVARHRSVDNSWGYDLVGRVTGAFFVILNVLKVYPVYWIVVEGTNREL